MVSLKVRKFGNSLGVILPQELLRQLKVAEGDQLYAVEVPGGGLEISAFSPEAAQQLEAAERIMREDREVLRKLAQ